MYLLFHLSEKDEIHLALFDETDKKDVIVSAKNRELLEVLSDLLHKEEVKKNDIRGIMVVVGKGGFSSTRIAAVVANTFAYVLHIPVLPIVEQQIAHIQSLIPQLLACTPGNYISATYSGEPNIGK